ncbi:MAG: hypothetical protein ACQCN6_08825 [Candidatus Bathyarchaeia archaeon]|jgi:hypothetical protein
MNKSKMVKIALSVLTIVLTVGPLLGVVCLYRDNLLGLVLPSFQNTAENSITNSDISNLDFTALESMEPIKPLGEPTYDQSTGDFSYPLNFTNPLPQELSLDNLSADIKTGNGELLGTISIPDAIHVSPGQSAVIDINGNIDQAALEAYREQYGDSAEISVENLIVTVGGISLHLDEIPGLGSIQLG